MRWKTRKSARSRVRQFRSRKQLRNRLRNPDRRRLSPLPLLYRASAARAKLSQQLTCQLPRLSLSLQSPSGNGLHAVRILLRRCLMSGRRTETMIRDSQMLERHIQGLPHGKIAEIFGVTEGTVHNGIRRAIRDRPKLESDEMRVVAEEELNMLRRHLNRMLRTPRYMVSMSGKLVTGPDGQPLIDHSETRQVAMALVKVNESYRKLFGLDTPIKHRIEITDKMDEQIEKLAQELARNGAPPPAIESFGELEPVPDEQRS